MATSKKGKAKSKARGGSKTISASTLAIMNGKAISEEMQAAERKARAALRKPCTVPQLRKAAGVGMHSARALLARLHAKPVDGQRGAYRI